ncbi:MAG: sensor histidine kinase, partial [Planctomycetota bacterium]
MRSMRTTLKRFGQRLLRLLRLWPLSLAEKCRIAFGAAVIFILALALLLPYIWMGQLTKKASLDAGRARTDSLMEQHFQLQQPDKAELPVLNNTGAVLEANDPAIQWTSFLTNGENKATEYAGDLKPTIETLQTQEDTDDAILLEKKEGLLQSTYVRVFRATETCMGCHNPQRAGTAFTRNQPIGAVIITRPAGEVSVTRLMNLIWIMVAGLIAGVGAIVAFYMITQRVILRPIRQLRALANNVAEGNLDTRSAIKTRDEYEKLANAFNHMLDRLQAAQEKLRQANKQLDEKIAQLSERNIELFKANKVKGEFLANISHEFRTPLNAILGFAEIMQEKPELITKEKGRRYAENIIAGGNRLLNMINDLLNI